MTQPRGHVVVTGAGGFVCSALALALAGAGWRVTGVDRAFDAAARERLTGIALVEADLLETPGIIAGLAPTALVHGAALTVAPEKIGLTRAAHLAANVGLLTHAMTEARQAGADRMLFLSSTGVFDTTDGVGEDRLTEDVMPTGQGPYSAAKRAGEEITRAAAEPGFATLSVRLGHIFGPGEAVRPSRQHLSLPHRMAAEAGAITCGSAGAQREWAWLPDLADGLAATLDALPQMDPGVIHAGNPPVMSDEDLAALIAPGRAQTFAATGPVRPPMGTVRPSPLRAVTWTPIATGLATLGLAGAPA